MCITDKSMLHECTARVMETETLARGIGRLRLYAPEIARTAQPGQFVQVEARGKFLRRPISLFDVDAQRGIIDLVIQRVGMGTAAILDLRSGDDTQVLGPLGTGFPVAVTAAAPDASAAKNQSPATAAPNRPISTPVTIAVNAPASFSPAAPAAPRTCWLVGGGVGIAPLKFLARTLRASGARVVSFLGYRGAEFMYAAAAFAAFGEAEIATDDGTAGVQGNAVDLLRARLARGERPDGIYTCGPTPMLRALQRLCVDTGLDAHASLEARMGCGIGACLTCNATIRSGDGRVYRRVCADGPVFRLSEVILDG